MSRRQLSAFLEACHAGPEDLIGWSNAVTQAIAPWIAPTHGMVVSLADRRSLSLSVLARHGRSGEMSARWPRSFFEAEMDQKSFDIMYRPFRVSSARSTATRGALAVDRHMARAFPGYFDAIGMIADMGELKLAFALPIQELGELSHKDARLRRLQRHLSGAAQRRIHGEWSAQAALILDERGHVMSAHENRLLERTSDIASAFARELQATAEPDRDVERLWDELWQGGWSVAHVQETDGRRVLVIRRTRAESRPRLTQRELSVLALAREGKALKNIAAELGITTATASTHLAQGLRKLGLRDRVQLVELSTPTSAEASSTREPTPSLR